MQRMELNKRLNEFQQSTDCKARQSINKALVDTLEEIVGMSPRKFLQLLPAFLDAKRPYQYGIINGFKRIWDKSKDKQHDLDWDVAWGRLIDFFAKLLDKPDFWSEEVVNDLICSYRDWIPPFIAEFLRAGTRDDNKAYHQTSDTYVCVNKNSIEKLEPVDDAKRIHVSGNHSPRGKAIEALFSHTLRVCRISDKERGDHSEAWDVIKPAFNAELAKCENTNYEFSTLAAAYLANIDYISRDWLRNNIDKIFPKDFPENFACAIDGLAYTHISLNLSVLLEHGILKGLCVNRLESKLTKKSLNGSRLAYLLGDETLKSPRYLICSKETRLRPSRRHRVLPNARRQELRKNKSNSISLFFGKNAYLGGSFGRAPKGHFQIKPIDCCLTCR